jgi:Secretion system C-terminal sorting domain
MKKLTLIIAFFLAVFASVTAQTVVPVSGEITTNTTWTNDNIYVLSGFVYVEDGAVLTIQPGTVIKGDKVTKGTLIVTRTGRIIADGTASQPIVFTSNEATPTYGDWGGLIILGKAPTNTSTGGTPCLGVVEGGVDTPEGDGRYGSGDLPGGCGNDNDNSGILRYVRIEYPGIAFQPNNEINGLTMAGVGSGTVIENIQVSYANDDSFEWFGGTVNCKFLVAYRGLDDDFDTDFGYNGRIQFAYAQRDPQVADVSGSNGFEIDNDASGSATTPKTRPIFSNVTVVGPTGTASNLYRRGAHLRRNSEPRIHNSVVIGEYPDAGLFIDGATTVANAEIDSLTVRNSFFYGMPTPLKSSVATFNITDWATARSISTGTNAADVQLVDPFNLNQPNPRPGATSPVLGAANFNNPNLTNFFFTQVSYAGAFGPSGDWTAGWTRFGDNLQQVGLAPQTTQEVNVSGFITQNTTWTANNTYVLNGFVYVKNCATLTIEPGTVIKGDKATKGALIVTRCAKIIADGTVTDPIVFTSSEPAGQATYGDWGGLIILGRAPTNTSTNGVPGLGVIEGGVNNQFGDGLYGGGDQPNGAIVDDNSGILRYVRIEYPGIAFQPNNEINGLTMGGVGNKTVVENVQVSYANDDSFEWFGGTVNCKFLVAYRGLDDDFDADFGYNGRIQFAYAQRDPQVADVSGSNGFEIDNDASGSSATPKTRPIFSNVTVVGPTGTASTLYRRGAHLRRNSEPRIHNSVVIGGYPDAGLFIDGATTVANAETDSLTVRNSFFYGMPTPLKTSVAAFNIADWATARSISTGTNSADVQLVDPFNLNLPNPRPGAGSPVLGAANFNNPNLANFFFTPVSYAGAFGPSGDWTAGWTRFGDNLQQVGLAPQTTQEVIVSGFITQNTTWTANNTYVLNGFVYVKNCATLTIEPGTVIKGDKATKGALIVTRCAKIIADGTESNPIVFTSGEPEDQATYGDWGGIVILGRAPTNTSTNGVPCLGVIEGGVDNQFGDGRYGSGDLPGGCGSADDNSGILRYVRIEYPGIAFQPNNEINGLTMGGVGSGTVVDHVQVSYANDDSFEWFGGTVNCKHLIAYRGLDDDFDADFGYSGNVQFALSVRDPQVADVSGSNGFEIDNDASGSSATPKTRPTFSNVTLLGPTGTPSTLYRRAAHLRRNAEPGIFNSILLGNYPVGVFIDGATTSANAQSGLLEIKNVWTAGATDLLNTSDAAFNIDTWYGTAGWGNAASPDVNSALLQDGFNLDAPNFQPTGVSPAIAPGAASFASPRIANAFFTPTTYIGAFDGTSDWTCGWAKFLVLNTDCFVDTDEKTSQIGSVRLMPTIANDQTTLEINLVQGADLQVEIYNLSGQFIRTAVNQRGVEGVQQFTLNTTDLTGGFYFVRVQAGTSVQVAKMIVAH